MKSLLLAVDVPDGYKPVAIDLVNDESDEKRVYEHQIKEITLPSDEEIIRASQNAGSGFVKDGIKGANFVIDNIKNQMK